ncbi:Ger(x)C family spore germination protein [Paenibacillus sp. MMS18-CY102]|uniref:Ger(x)C family spore germination protein n=1 Tax=Paenibacillus sp. MMS18-CY102 TaxID=2682849 RepID=UPI001366532A|nr:Ger(x)C family spore germination protein [Paenibacillus sp. MMS18-CY102]MWC27244.1 Ger(x)C family spore germination protein [Paenibacillus sp. MMS18-CY102]
MKPLIRLVPALLLSAALLTGCWDRTEINDLAIVTAAGMDLADDGKIKLSVQLFVPSASISDPTSSAFTGGSNQTIVRSAAGLNLADATARLQETLSRRVFWGQADVFIFGQKLAERGIHEPMDFLTRHPHPRERANLFVSEGEATEVLALHTPTERNTAELLREMAILQSGLNITMLQAVEELSEEAHTAVIPMVVVKKRDKTMVPYIGGTAAFKDLKIADKLDTMQTRGLQWLRNEIKTATITAPVPPSGDFASVYIFKAGSNLVPSIKNGKWSIKVHIKAIGNLNETADGIDVTKEPTIKQLQQIFQTALQKRIDESVRKAQQIKTDYLGFAEQFHRHYPKQWRKAKTNWDALFPEVTVTYDIKLTIARNGLTGKNTSLQRSEGP